MMILMSLSGCVTGWTERNKHDKISLKTSQLKFQFLISDPIIFIIEITLTISRDQLISTQFGSF